LRVWESSSLTIPCFLSFFETSIPCFSTANTFAHSCCSAYEYWQCFKFVLQPSLDFRSSTAFRYPLNKSTRRLFNHSSAWHAANHNKKRFSNTR
jgi:hypothetical protein